MIFKVNIQHAMFMSCSCYISDCMLCMYNILYFHDFVVDDPYSDTHVRVKWSASRSMTRLPPQPDMPTFLQSIGFPLLFLVMCLYMALSAIITQLYQDFPLLDVRKLWLTQTGYVIFFGKLGSCDVMFVVNLWLCHVSYIVIMSYYGM